MMGEGAEGVATVATTIHKDFPIFNRWSSVSEANEKYCHCYISVCARDILYTNHNLKLCITYFSWPESDSPAQSFLQQKTHTHDRAHAHTETEKGRGTEGGREGQREGGILRAER